MARPDLRPGATVRYEPVHSGISREGKLVRASANSEEWLVKNDFGRFWIHVTRLSAPDTRP